MQEQEQEHEQEQEQEQEQEPDAHLSYVGHMRTVVVGGPEQCAGTPGAALRDAITW